MAETSKSFIKKFLGFSLVTWISFALSFITAPISTRLFEPEVLGKINIFNTYSNLIGTFILLGLDQAYARFFNERPNNRTKGYLLSFCFAVTYAAILVFVVLAVPIRSWLSRTLFDETDNLLITLMFLSVLCSSTLRYLNLTYRMEQNITMFTIQGVLMTIMSKVLYIGIGFWDPSYKSALIVLTGSNLLLTIVFLLIQRNRFEKIKEYDKFFSSEVFKFALPLIPVSVIMWANSSIPQIIMQKTMDYHSIGIFASAMGLANLILVIQSGFNTFWVPYTYENYKTQTGQFFKVHRYLMCSLTLFALLMVCTQDIIFLILGEKYRAAKAFFPFLILGPTCYVAGEVSGVGIDLVKKTYLKIYVFVFSVIANIVACFFLRIPFGVAGIAMGTLIAAIVAMIAKTVYGERYYKVVTDYKYMSFCIVSILLGAAATLWVHNMPLRVLVTFFILISSCVFYRGELKDLWGYLVSFVRK